ncbi:cbb3-type cytochrome c oxidase subunit I [Halorubellus sp. PRR65]|uniref:nitric-oxide reductase large subunit n=1 Tax=Halorubellus sp. PRR65 TaxID=3098148 RepID=UPI002B26087F|nr:cbb3-type cytochrome c oxidase subunit I [Halorubellus sp. PRR65]
MRLERGTIAKLLVAVFVGNLVVMAAGAAYSYQHQPAIPDRIEGPDGDVVLTETDVRDGKVAFQRNGLMNHGSILGNGAYYGEDYTADALSLKVEFMREYHAERRHDADYAALSPPEQAAVDSRVQRDLDSGAGTDGVVRYSAAEAYAHERVREVYVERYHEGSDERGVPEGMIATEDAAREFADFAMWTALVSHTDRPGSEHSYTNEWPYNEAAGNTPAGATMTWSVGAMVLLVAAAGIGVWLYTSVELPEPEVDSIAVPDPGDVALLPSQRAASRYVPVAAALFVVQVLLGALLAHFYVERAAFFGLGDALGVNVLQLLPFALAKTYHIDLAIVWIATLWLGAGLFLPGLLTNHEPANQARYVNGLLGALVVVVVGSVVGVYLGSQGYFGDLWWILGNEGLEYLEVGRLWQAGLLAGFVAWAVLVARGFKPLLDREPRYGLAHMILYAGGSIALLFVAGNLYTPQSNIVMTEFWRWWVVHMWVEGAFEFFIVAVVGITLVSMGLLKKRSAEKAVMFEALFVMGSGVIGVSHHYWWVGQPDVWIPFGSVFSTLELVPLVFILFEAINEYRALAAGPDGFPYSLPFAFIVASGVWNFVGAGVLGFFINLPLVNYFEHGTYLTVAHAHAAMFGAFGFLALGMATYMLRLSVDPARWVGRRIRWAFWLWNAGLAIMVVVSLLPVGFLQLETAFTEGYAVARSLAFYERDLVQLFFWARFPGDVLLIAGTVVFAYDVVKKRFVLRDAASEDDAATGTGPIAGRVFADTDPADARASDDD